MPSKDSVALVLASAPGLTGQEASPVEGVQLEGTDLHLQFWRKLALEVAQSRFTGEIVGKSCTTPQGLALLSMAQDVQHFMPGNAIGLTAEEAESVQGARRKRTQR